jgi:hypothetical protein
MTSDQPRNLHSLLAEQLTRKYGTLTLESGIRAAIADATAKVKAGYAKERSSTNTGLRVHASEAGGCARAIGLRLLGLVPEEITEDLKTTFLVGDLLHEALQAALEEAYPGFASEHSWLADHISGRADGVYFLQSYKTIVEIKTASKSSFQYSLWKGPRPTHVLQAALSALTLGATKLHLIYIGKEPVKRPKALLGDPTLPDPMSIHDWVLDLEEEGAREEQQRLTRVVHQVAGGDLPDTETAFGWIDQPDNFKSPCSWCRAKPLCKRLGPGVHPITKVLEMHPGHVVPDLTPAVTRA